ncbi:MAG: S8 family serine peptidase [Deltaproteobacteria bacterium]|nr:S8 family serine peptidase [Deltaproteobacteria bacterium]
MKRIAHALALSTLVIAGAAEAGVVRSPDAIPGQYIVVMKPAATAALAGHDAVERVAQAHAAPIVRRYGAALRGFSTTLSPEEAERLAADPDVDLVVENSLVRGSATRTNATFGLDRIDQPALPLDGRFVELGDGAGVTVYVIDSGVRATHGELAGRVLEGAFAIQDGRGVADCNGHGTHVSATIAGTTFGVARRVNIVPVRVLDCTNSGPLDGIIAGIDFVARNAAPNSVANMSLGATANAALDAAVRGLVAAGVTVVVAAGNDAADACRQSPARERSAITVGATNRSDTRASFSNFGTCVDIFAPGEGITSAGLASDTATAVLDGTSMAAPHVTGVVAAYLGNHPGSTPAQVAAALLGGATPGVLADTRGAPNLLVSTRFLDTEPPTGTILSPADGERVGSSFVVEAEIFDASLERVELRLDGRLVETLTSGDIRFRLTNVTRGAHRIELTAVDALGQSAAAELSVIVGDGDDEGGDGDELVGGCSAGGTAGVLPLLGAAAALIVRRRRRVAAGLFAAAVLSACTTGEGVDTGDDGSAGIDGNGRPDGAIPPPCTDPLVDLDGDGIPDGLDLDCDGDIDVDLDPGTGGTPGACDVTVAVNGDKKQIVCTATQCVCRRNDQLVRTCTPTGQQSCSIDVPANPALNCCGF